MLLALLLSVAPAASAHTFSAHALTDFPVLIGVGAGYESPQRVRLDASGGFMPGPYLDATNATLVAFDVYSETTAELIDILLQGSLVLRAEAGWRPWDDRGWYAGLGYQFLGLAGDTTDLSLYTDGIEADILRRAEEQTGSLEVSVAPHMLTGRIGHEWILQERFVVRGSLGFAYTVSSSSTVSSTESGRGAAAQAAIDAVESAAESYLDDVFESWVHSPMLGVSGGYRF